MSIPEEYRNEHERMEKERENNSDVTPHIAAIATIYVGLVVAVLNFAPESEEKTLLTQLGMMLMLIPSSSAIYGVLLVTYLNIKRRRNNEHMHQLIEKLRNISKSEPNTPVILKGTEVSYWTHAPKRHPLYFQGEAAEVLERFLAAYPPKADHEPCELFLEVLDHTKKMETKSK